MPPSASHRLLVVTFEKNRTVNKINLQNSSRKYLTTKNTFTISLIVIALTIIGIWLFGIGQKRTLFENSILSTSILSITFFFFLTLNLYRGVKLKDDLGKITDKINRKNIPVFSNIDLSSGGIPDIGGDGIGGFIVGILAWILISIVLVFIISVLGAFLWVMILVFAAMLYWIFYRALRFGLKHSQKTKGSVLKSVGFGLFYTLVYNFWIYGIILTAQYFAK
ncbi:MAG: hypothetical protein WCY16_05090 [Weeksellaceae bacterium]